MVIGNKKVLDTNIKNKNDTGNRNEFFSRSGEGSDNQREKIITVNEARLATDNIHIYNLGIYDLHLM